ncbi:MAG: GDSL-type esterase/lipase family protein [Phycisphaerae bacterium]
MTTRTVRAMACVVTVLLLAGFAAAGDIQVKDGQKIAFLGDSITAGGNAPLGYVGMVISGLEANGVKATKIPAGVSGHKSDQMLARLQRDVIDKKPDWMTLSCGVNDVWHGARGVKLEDYKTNITEIVTRAKKAGIKVMILTSTMISEDAKAGNNVKLAAYNAFLVELAKSQGCLLADLNADMQKAIAEAVKTGAKPGRILTSDGVHMNPFGNAMMATGVLRAFGLDDQQIAKAAERWNSAEYSMRSTVNLKMTFAEYKRFIKIPEPERKALMAQAEAEYKAVIMEKVKGK